MTTPHRIHLTPRGRLTLATCVTWFGFGLLGSAPIATIVATILACWLGTGFMLGLAAQRTYAHGDASIELLMDGSPADRAQIAVRVGKSVSLPFRMRLKGIRGFTPTDLKPLSSGDGVTVKVRPMEGGNSQFRITPTRIGDAYVHGVDVHGLCHHGIFRISFWCPSRVYVQVAPRGLHTNRGLGLRTGRVAMRAHTAALSARRKGFGVELRELRDYQPGDPYKHIAWKATARRGRLISREFESDLAMSTWLCLDVSPSMFSGQAGAARIDFGMETVFSIVSVMNRYGQRSGLTLFDSEVRHTVPLGVGKLHLDRVSRALREVTSLVHEGRTEVSRAELARAARQWFLAQRGQRLQLPASPVSPAASYDLGRLQLVSTARRVLNELIQEEHDGRPTIPPMEYDPDPDIAVLRAFARYAGISLSLDPTPVPNGQSYGLASALESVLHAPAGPHTVIAVSDLGSAEDLEAVHRVANALRRKKHRVVVFCPSHPVFGPNEDPASVLHAALDHTSRIASHQKLRHARASLQSAGVSFLHCGPEDVLGRLLERLRRAA